MITFERTKTILDMAIPIAAALGSSLILVLIDLAMVGRLGTTAVAAVGLASFLYSIVSAFMMGIAPAVQGIVARRLGENSTEPRGLPLGGGLLIALGVGMPLTAAFYLLTPLLFSFVSSDPAVTAAGVPFLRVLYLTLLAVGVNSAFRGFWTGMEKQRVYMLISIATDCLNVLLNYVLIFGKWGCPAFGIVGSALATAISLYTSALVSYAVTRMTFRSDRLFAVKPTKSLVARMIELAVPATMQEFFFSAGYIVFFWLVGQVGTADLAAANVLIRVTMVLVLVAMALGMTSATLVSKSMGEKDPNGAAAWGWDTGKVGVTFITLLGLPLLLFPRHFLEAFLTDPHAIDIAIFPLRLVAATTGIGSLIYIFSYTLYTVGDGKRVIMISFGTQWLFFLPAVWFVGPYLKHGLQQIWLVQMAYGAIATILITRVWSGGRWKAIEV